MQQVIDEERSRRTYWYADFEADPTSTNHTSYFCHVQGVINTIGGDTIFESRSFMGTNCAELVLDYLPDHSVMYFQ